MASPTQVAPEAFDLAAKAYDSIELAVSTLYDLSAIFRAIYQAEQFRPTTSAWPVLASIWPTTGEVCPMAR